MAEGGGSLAEGMVQPFWWFETATMIALKLILVQKNKKGTLYRVLVKGGIWKGRKSLLMSPLENY